MARTSTPITTATRQELRQAGAAGSSALGKLALNLAARLDRGNESGSAHAAMAKELRMVLDRLVTGAVPAKDPIDELKQRRERRQRGA